MALSTRPTLIVQVAFDDGALVASPTWTTIAARSVRVSRGRSDETQRFGPGTATVVVPNKDRLFDPNYTAGTYFGKLLPMRQLRIRATWNAVTYDIFRGHVEGWPQTYNESNRDAYVELVANDALTYLNNVDLPTWRTFIPQLAAPVLWYTLDDNNDGEDYNVVRDIVGGASGVYMHDDVNAFIDFNQDPIAPTGNSVNFDGGLAKLDAGALGMLASDHTWSIAFAFSRASGAPGSAAVLFQSGFGLSTYADMTVYIYTDGRLYVDTGGTSPGTLGAPTNPNVCDGQPHSVVITRNSTVGSGTHVYLDGVEFPSGSATWASTTDFQNQSQLGAPVGPNEELWEPCTNTRIDEFMGWTSVLSATNAALVGLALISFNKQTASARVGSLLDLVGWPSALRSLASTGPTLGPASLGSKLLNELQITEASEQGRLFVDASGNVVLHSRWRDRTDSSATAIQATFADDGADLKYLGKGFEYGYEIDRIVNSCTVTGANNIEVTATDSTSVTSYGMRSKSISTHLTDIGEARNLAEYIVNRYKNPVLRAKTFGVNAERAATTMWPALLGLEIGDRINLQRTPQNVGTQISTNLLVEHIDHDIDQDSWETKLLGSPVDPNTESSATYWVLGTSTFDSQTVVYF